MKSETAPPDVSIVAAAAMGQGQTLQRQTRRRWQEERRPGGDGEAKRGGRRSTHRRGWTEQTQHRRRGEDESTPDRLDENKHGFYGCNNERRNSPESANSEGTVEEETGRQKKKKNR